MAHTTVTIGWQLSIALPTVGRIGTIVPILPTVIILNAAQSIAAQSNFWNFEFLYSFIHSAELEAIEHSLLLVLTALSLGSE